MDKHEKATSAQATSMQDTSAQATNMQATSAQGVSGQTTSTQATSGKKTGRGALIASIIASIVFHGVAASGILGIGWKWVNGFLSWLACTLNTGIIAFVIFIIACNSYTEEEKRKYKTLWITSITAFLAPYIILILFI